MGSFKKFLSERQTNSNISRALDKGDTLKAAHYSARQAQRENNRKVKHGESRVGTSKPLPAHEKAVAAFMKKQFSEAIGLGTAFRELRNQSKLSRERKMQLAKQKKNVKSRNLENRDNRMNEGVVGNLIKKGTPGDHLRSGQAMIMKANRMTNKLSGVSTKQSNMQVRDKSVKSLMTYPSVQRKLNFKEGTLGNNIPRHNSELRKKLADGVRGVKRIFKSALDAGNIPRKQSEVNREVRNIVKKTTQAEGVNSTILPKGSNKAFLRLGAAEHLKSERKHFKKLASRGRIDKKEVNNAATGAVARLSSKLAKHIDAIKESSGFKTSKAIRRDPLKIKIDTLQRRLKLLRAQKKANSPEAINVMRQLKDLRARKRNI